MIPVYRRDCHQEVYAGSHVYPGQVCDCAAGERVLTSGGGLEGIGGAVCEGSERQSCVIEGLMRLAWEPSMSCQMALKYC